MKRNLSLIDEFLSHVKFVTHDFLVKNRKRKVFLKRLKPVQLNEYLSSENLAQVQESIDYAIKNLSKSISKIINTYMCNERKHECCYLLAEKNVNRNFEHVFKGVFY